MPSRSLDDGEDFMGNSRVKDRFGLALDGKQVIALGVGVTVLVASVFVLGMNLPRR